jgi:hypothetical protein
VPIVGGIDAGVSEDEDALDGVDACGEDPAGMACRGELFVGLLFTNSVMSSGVFAGVTLSMNCQEGNSNTIELVSEWSGTGMSDADNISFCEFVSSHYSKSIETAFEGWPVHTPLLGCTLPLSTASMMLPFSSATSRTQSVLPVATMR